MAQHDLFIYIVLLFAAVFSVLARKLTIAGGLAAAVTGLLIYKGFEITGLVILVAFFILGTAATKWGAGEKEKAGIAERDKGRRTAGQVFANGGMAAILAAVAWRWQVNVTLLLLMMAGSLASATADTLSSELGSIYGSRFFDILSFKRSERGPDGVISVEGTLIGLGGAMVIAFVYCCFMGWDRSFGYIIIAGTLGNLADSVFGATLERKRFIGNNAVNFMNTAVGAMACLSLMSL